MFPHDTPPDDRDRIALVQHSESERPLDPMPSGPAPTTLHCDLCRQRLGPGAAYFPYTIGVEDEPSYVGFLGSVVEQCHELVICQGCNPLVTERFEALLASLWSLRADDPAPATDATTEETPL